MTILDFSPLDPSSIESIPALLQHVLQRQTPITTADGLSLFDCLDAIDIDFMIGRWQGVGIPSGHPMDGMLEATHWYGKEFVDAETVHPLLFSTPNGDVIKVAPNPNAMKMTLNLPLPKNLDHPLIQFMFNRMNSIFKTEQSQARLRMMEYRSKVSATMIYDHLPINDSFRKIDDNQVLGVMDYKEINQPFFFALKRVL